MFTVAFGAFEPTATATVAIETSDDLDTWTPLDDPTIEVDATYADKIVMLDLTPLPQRYIRCTVTRETDDSAIVFILGQLYSAMRLPVDLLDDGGPAATLQARDFVAGEQAISEALG